MILYGSYVYINDINRNNYWYFLDRLIPSKEERIEKEYVKVLKDVIEEDLQKNVKKKNSNKI